MMTQIEFFLRRIRRIFSRTEWAIWLLRLPKQKTDDGKSGLIMVQIDGLSLTQFNRAVQKGHLPFLRKLLNKERYLLHSFYSGLPSNTPAVQGELFYGIKGCVPAFNFVDRQTGQSVKMFDAPYVEQFEPFLKAQANGLLTGGSAYSDIFTGNAKEAHFCWAQMGWGGVLHAANPVVLPFLFILYIDIFLRTFALLVIEFFIALFECIRGTVKGRLFFRELELVWLRVLVCILLREFIVAGVSMDIVRGVSVIHMNFLGYDEQAHCRGPSSRFAHWSLQGIDYAIKRIYDVSRQEASRTYDLWVYSDHGQEKTTPYFIKHGRTIEEAVEKLFGTKAYSFSRNYDEVTKRRAQLLGEKKSRKSVRKKNLVTPLAAETSHPPHVIVTAMGPLGHIYLNEPSEKKEIDFYAQKLVNELEIPLVLTRRESQQVTAWTARGAFVLPDQMSEVFGKDHFFLEEMKEDLMRVCLHPNAGEFIIAGWCAGSDSISFPLEYGAHASMGPEETKAFALLPMEAPLRPKQKKYLRPIDLREAAEHFINNEPLSMFWSPSVRDIIKQPLKLMSYNVHGCLGLDGTISTDRIARVIVRQQPDIIALQELDVGRMRSQQIDQAEKIARKLEMKYHFHPTFRWGSEQYGNAILSRYPMALIKTKPLPQFDDKMKYEPRGAMWVTVDFHGVKIQVINTHLSIWRYERLLQINALLGEEWIGSPECYHPLILCGDFNAVPGSLAYRKICQRLLDSQAVLEGHRPYRTWWGRYPLSQIDYIFITEDFRVQSISVPRTSLDIVASDHLPLIAELNLKRISAPNVNQEVNHENEGI